LLALFDFITTGDVTAMAPNDRRSWLHFIMRSTRSEDTHKEDGTDIDAMKVSLKKTVKKTRDEDSVQEAVDLVNNNTWRGTILGLKTMYRGVSQYVEHGEDFETPVGIYERIINMRQTMHDVIKIQKHKYEKKLQDDMIRIQIEEEEALAATAAAESGVMEASLALPDILAAETIDNDDKSQGTESLENPLEEEDDDDDDDDDDDGDTKSLNVYASNVGAMLGKKKKKSAFPSHFVVEEDDEDDDDGAFDD